MPRLIEPCALPGCSKSAMPGSAHCSSTHRDVDRPTRGGSRFNQKSSPIRDTDTENLCQIIGCMRPAVPGSPRCASNHRDIANLFGIKMASTSANKTGTLQSDRYSESDDDSGRGGSRFNQNLSQIHDSYTAELCQIVGCLRPVVPDSPYCAGSHRSNSNVFVTKTASTSASKTGNFQAGESDSDSGSDYPHWASSHHGTSAKKNKPPRAKMSESDSKNNLDLSKSSRRFDQNSSCQFLGCSRPAYPGISYCSRRHRDNVNSSSITTAPFVQNRTSEAKTSYHDNERKGCDFAETSTFHRSDEIPSRKYMTYMPCNFPGCSNSIVPGRVYCLSHRGIDPAQGGGWINQPARDISTDELVPNVYGIDTISSSAYKAGSPQAGKFDSDSETDLPIPPKGPSSTYQSRTCHFPGCSKRAFLGVAYCSRIHQDTSHSQGNTRSNNLDLNQDSPSRFPRTRTVSTDELCQTPGCSKHVYLGSQYCSRNHRDNAQAAIKICAYLGCTKSVFPGSNFCSKNHRDNDTPSTPTNTTGGKICRHTLCTKPVFPGSDFCTKSHRDYYICKFSKCSNPVMLGSQYCGQSHGDAATVVTHSQIHEIVFTDSKYNEVKTQWENKWLHKTRKPNTHRIYRITLPSNLMAKYTKYQQQVESRGSFKSNGRSAGNECRRFHGTNRACTIGDNGNTNICSQSNCSLCSIIRTSYRLNLAGSNKPWTVGTGGGRFGSGIYTSATSSKCNDYSQNVGIASPYKALLLNKVVVGKTQKLFKDSPSLTQPPTGFDSITGEPGTATQKSTLNYDELVVYNESAIIPAFLIIYAA